MAWLDTITQFNALVQEVISRVPKARLERELRHDKQTVNGWVAGSIPENPSDVGRVLRIALENGIDISPYQTMQPVYDFAEFTRYEDKVADGPPDLSWLTSVGFPPKVETKISGLTAKLPLGLASSPLTANARWTSLGLDLGYGLSTLKTRRATSKPSWLAPQVGFVKQSPDLRKYNPSEPPQVVVTLTNAKDRRIHDLVNSIGVPSEDSPLQWQEEYRRVKEHPRGHQVGLSVLGEGDTLAELQKDLMASIELAIEGQPPFVELNLSCPNLKSNVAKLWTDLPSLQSTCSLAKAKLKGTGTLLFLKLPLLPTIQLKRILSALSGIVDGLVYRNTIRVKAVIEEPHGGLFIPAFPGRDFGGLSGPSTFELTRRGIAELRDERGRLGIKMILVAVGGVSTAGHVAELLDAGADFVQACTAAMYDPLLPWKTAFHLQRIGAGTRAAVRSADELEVDLQLRPRDEVEEQSWRHLQIAVREIRQRTGTEHSHENVIIFWNEWMERRPSIVGLGAAQRRQPALSVLDWVRVLTR